MHKHLRREHIEILFEIPLLLRAHNDRLACSQRRVQRGEEGENERARLANLLRSLDVEAALAGAVFPGDRS